MTKHAHALALFSALGLVAFGVVSLAAATGCNAPEAAPDTKPASSVDAEKKDAFDRDGYCAAMCERSA